MADDGVLGYRLARRGFYTFRHFDGNLEGRIAQEQAKPIGDQGARTAAREIRRTLRYLGLIDALLALTEVGNQLLAANQGSPEELSVWQATIAGLELLDSNGDLSHPICILLRLVGHFGQLQREDLALALEALDDSQNEFQRIVNLVPARDAIDRGDLQVSEFQLANSIKILPALAEQAGFITRLDQAHPYALTQAGQLALDACLIEGPIGGAVVAPQPQGAGPAPGPGPQPVRQLPQDPTTPAALGPQAGAGALTAEQQQAAMRLRFERTARHQRVVKNLADQLRDGLNLYEGTTSFDVVALREAVPEDPLLLVEVKTLGTDAITQTRLAVGQLLYYENTVVSPRWPGREVLKAAVFDGPIPQELREFLDWLGIGGFRVAEGVIEALNARAEEIKHWIDDRV